MARKKAPNRPLWSNWFLTTKDTILPGDFVNASGTSILDLFKAHGFTAADFYQQNQITLDQFLAREGHSFLDFKREGMTIPDALNKINTEGTPLDGSSPMWTVERLLCFKGNTYNEFLVPTGAIAFFRMDKLTAGSINHRVFAAGFTLTTIAAGILAYSLAMKGDLKPESVVVDSEVKFVNDQLVEEQVSLINQHVGAYLPRKSSDMDTLLGRPAALDGIERKIKQALPAYGEGMAGNYFSDVSKVASMLAQSMGKTEVDQAVLDAMSQRFSSGMPVSKETCETVSETASFNGIGAFDHSPALYFGALSDDAAASTLKQLVSQWEAGNMREMPAGVSHVGSYQELTNHVVKGSCQVAPVTVYQPRKDVFSREGYFLVSVLTKTPLSMGSAQVSQSLFLLAENEGPGSEFYRANACVNCTPELTASFEKVLPAAYPKQIDPETACKKLDSNDQLSLADRAGYFGLFASHTSRSADLASVRDAWVASGEDGLETFGFQEVGLDEFLRHRRKGECGPTQTLVYKLNSDTTPYLLSTLTFNGSEFKPVISMAYDLSSLVDDEARGMFQIPCDHCGTSEDLDQVQIGGIKGTITDFGKALKSAGYEKVEMDPAKLKEIVLSHLAGEGLNFSGESMRASTEALNAAITKQARENAVATYSLTQMSAAALYVGMAKVFEPSKIQPESRFVQAFQLRLNNYQGYDPKNTGFYARNEDAVLDEEYLIGMIKKFLTGEHVVSDEKLAEGIKYAIQMDVEKSLPGFSIERAIDRNEQALNEMLLSKLYGYRFGSGDSAESVFGEAYELIKKDDPYLANIGQYEIIEILGEAYSSGEKKGELMTNAINSMSPVLAQNGFWK